MTTFEVRDTKLPAGEDATLDYAKMCILLLNNVPVNGLSFGEMASRLDLLKRFKDAKVGDTVELEEKDVVALKSCMGTMRWTVLSEDIVAFGEYISSLAETSA